MPSWTPEPLVFCLLCDVLMWDPSQPLLKSRAMIMNQMSPAEHISHAIRSLIEAAELTEGMLSDSGREHFASILFRVEEHVEQARAKIAADKLPRQTLPQ